MDLKSVNNYCYFQYNNYYFQKEYFVIVAWNGKCYNKFKPNTCNEALVAFKLKAFNPSWKKVAFTIDPNCLFILCVYSFNCVMNRPGLRAVLSEKFLEVFGWFETELENVQKIYESQKV